MKKILILLFWGCLPFYTIAQENEKKSYFQHSLSAEISGHRLLYGIGYDFRWRRADNPHSFGGGIGTGLGILDGSTYKKRYSFMRAFYAYGKRKSSIETGIVYMFGFNRDSWAGGRTSYRKTERGYDIFPYIAYRYQKNREGGFFFRSYICPFVYTNSTVIKSKNEIPEPTIKVNELKFVPEGIGISIGYTFPNKI